jgi:hypothetical protein
MHDSAAIHPDNLGLLMLRCISNSCQYGQAKHCAINAFDTYDLMWADEVMAIILHLAQNMGEELLLSVDPSTTLCPTILYETLRKSAIISAAIIFLTLLGIKDGFV